MRLPQALLLGLLVPLLPAVALDIVLPTGNDALLRKREADFFQPTVEGTVESGKFGWVRRNGSRFHEGIDIKALQRDRRGEAADPIYAVADGAVAFINARPSLSNYGRYIVLRHHWDGVEVHTLYAHLSAVAPGLDAGQAVRKGQAIATMGRSANTREGIPPERAHLHFEVNFLINTGFAVWNRKRQPDAPPFGNYNGQNFIGLDPAAFLRDFSANPKQNFAAYIARQPVAFTVLVSARPFPWLTLHPEQIQRTAPDAVPVGYEIGATAWGLPVAVWPRTANDLTDSQRQWLQRGAPLISRINQPELAKHPNQSLITRNRNTWQLTPKGHDWLSLLTCGP